MFKYKLTAVIPTTSYGNLQPSVEMEGENLAELKETSFEHIKEVWKQYGEKPMTDNFAGGVELDTFTGETIVYNDATHKYFDTKGNMLISGSEYAKTFTKPFNKEMLLPKTATAWKVSKDDLEEIWDLSGKVSTEYGTALHHALEIYHRFKDVGAKIQEAKKLEDNYVLAKLPPVRAAVLEFEEKFGLNAELEVLVSDVKNLRAGRIDRLEILDEKKKVCRIGDFKTNYEMTDKKLETYQHQLSFYAGILQEHGWTVEGLDVYHYSDGWTKHSLEVLPIS